MSSSRPSAPDSNAAVGMLVGEDAFCNLPCCESVLGHAREIEYETVIEADAARAGLRCAACEEPLSVAERTPRTFTCSKCGETHVPGRPTGDLFYCCGEKMSDSLRTRPVEAARRRSRAATEEGLQRLREHGASEEFLAAASYSPPVRWWHKHES